MFRCCTYGTTAVTGSVNCRAVRCSESWPTPTTAGSFRLDKNAALIMVTDGVVEGPSLPLEAGLERVATLAAQAAHDGLNTEETADRILDAMVAVDHIDDAAVLIIRRA